MVKGINNMNKNGYITDFISGKKVKSTPEEVEAVQVFAKSLVEDYGYSKAQIQTRPQYRVKVRPSDTKKEYPVDIAVFENDSKNDDSLRIVVECKRKSKNDGLSQLQDYLRFSRANIGVWFNGNERQFIRKVEKSGEIKFVSIPNIPRKGERLEDIGKHRRKDLIVPHNLKSICSSIRNHLAGNAVGVTRDELIAAQMINIIFCKIYDEKFTKPDEMVTFRAGINEDSSAVATRIKTLFEKVKTKYKEVVNFSDAINLDDDSVLYIVGELQNYCLILSERDVIADAFETFIGYALKGGLGQFFTPRNVVKLLVEIVAPQPDEIIIDPACGSGGFLVESLKYVWDKLEEKSKDYKWSGLTLNEEKTAVAINNIRGIEKDNFLSKVAKAYMVLLGDGKGGIFCEDSLEKTVKWKDKTRQSIDLEKFDVLLTNPPFGKAIKVVGEEKLAQYDLAKKWKKTDNGFQKGNQSNTEMRPEILFVERSLQLLKDGGRMGIVLPETFFHAPGLMYVMEFIEKHNIQWVIDLPHNTFRPHNNAKCLAVVLQKSVSQQSIINFAVAEEMGHDHQGKEIFRWDSTAQKVNKEQLWDDIQLILKEYKTKNKKYIFTVPSKLAKDKKIFVPRYYWENSEKEISKIAEKQNLKLVSMQDLIDEKVISFFDGHGSPPAECKGRGDIPYIRVKDIVNWEVYKDPTSKIPENIYTEMKKADKTLRETDVLYVRRGSYRIGSVAMVSPYDVDVLLTREILVLRVANDNKHGLTPHYLLYLLSHRLVTMQSFNKVLIETTLPNIADRWKELKLPMFQDDEQKLRITKKVESAIGEKWKAIQQIQEIIKECGEITT